MKQVVTIEYSILKTSTNKVLEFTKDYIQENKIDMRTSIDDDLSLWDLDGFDYLDKFQERFDLNLPERAYEYLCEPNLKMNTIQKIFYIPLYCLSMPFLIIAYPLLSIQRKESIRKKIKRNKKRLTLGDLAVTLAIGEFVKREETILTIK